MIKEPTEEQRKIIDDTGNIVVTARPGSGKTYTVVEKIARALEDLYDYQGIIAISFTNKASDELKSRCRRKGLQVKSSFFGTIDKFYISQIIIPFASHVTGKTVDFKIEENFKNHEQYSELAKIDDHVSGRNESMLISSLRDGLIFLNISGETAMYILQHSAECARYLKARYKNIFIDEYQDCGKIEHEIFLQLVKMGITGMAVGDVNQAIYGFNNRFPKYLISLMSNSSFKHYELTINHRCHESISEYSLCLYGASSRITDEKRVYMVNVEGGEKEIANGIDYYLDGIKNKYSILQNCHCAILCRSNMTVNLMDRYIKTPHKKFDTTKLDKDQSDWARLFIELLRGRFDPEVSAADIADEFYSYEYEERKYQLAMEQIQVLFDCNINDFKQMQRQFHDIGEFIYPKSENNKALNELSEILSDEEQLSTYMPAKENEINIMTIHKAKGLEFNAVFQMDMYRHIFPFENCSDEDYHQMLNLHYVAVTRAIDVCYLMNGTKRYNKKQNKLVSADPSPFYDLPGLEERRNNVYWKLDEISK